MEIQHVADLCLPGKGAKHAYECERQISWFIKLALSMEAIVRVVYELNGLVWKIISVL